MSVEPLTLTIEDSQPVERCSLFRRAAWRSRDATVGIVLALLIAGIVYFPSRWHFATPSLALFVVSCVVLQFGVLLAIPLWLLRRRGYAPSPRSWTAGFVVKEFFIAIPMTIGVFVVAATVIFSARFILSKLTIPVQAPMDFWGRFPLRYAIAFSVMAVTIAPVAEEIFFRGFLYNALRRVCPVWIAAVAQACLFGVGHLYEPLGIVAAFAIGLLLAAIYEWRKTLLANILVHGMFNLLPAVAIIAIAWSNANAPVIGITCSPDENEGLVIDKVFPGSPAEKADLRSGDVIVNYNGSGVADYSQLIRLIRKGTIGDTATLEIIRDGTGMIKSVTLGSPEELK
jgi:membrane protease YdiL (CAAX protease family)